jgi:hypothetical protein
VTAGDTAPKVQGGVVADHPKPPGPEGGFHELIARRHRYGPQPVEAVGDVVGLAPSGEVDEVLWTMPQCTYVSGGDVAVLVDRHLEQLLVRPSRYAKTLAICRSLSRSSWTGSRGGSGPGNRIGTAATFVAPRASLRCAQHRVSMGRVRTWRHVSTQLDHQPLPPTDRPAGR